MKKYILALDEGTTSARAILFDRDSNIIAMSQHEFSQKYPEPGWVEQDPMDIYANQYAALTECIAKSGIENMKSRKTLKVFEAFAGYGGASFGLKRAGIKHKVVGYSEFDPDIPDTAAGFRRGCGRLSCRVRRHF